MNIVGKGKLVHLTESRVIALARFEVAHAFIATLPEPDRLKYVIEPSPGSSAVPQARSCVAGPHLRHGAVLCVDNV